MSSYHNNANFKIVHMIQQLQQWNKKPSLNDKISEFLEIFHDSIKNEQINFAEAGLFLQESSVLNGKQIDLLYKGFLECHKNLSDVYNDDKPKIIEIVDKPIEQEITQTNVELAKKERKKHEIKKPEIAQIIEISNTEIIENVDNIENVIDIVDDILNPPPPEKLSIPGIPDEILEKLKLSDCLPGGPIDEFIDKLDQNHPLYSIISKLGKEISQNKDIFTYNNLSLSGMSWNALFKIEEVLSRITRKDDDLNENDDSNDNDNDVGEQCQQQTQTDDDSGIGTEHFLSGTTTILQNTLSESGEDVSPSAEKTAEPVEPPPKEPVVLTEELKQTITKECIEKVAQINLLKLDFKLLTKKFNFRLPSEYFAERRSERLKRKSVEETVRSPFKRKKPEFKLNLQKTKTFDLELFDNFCYDYYASQGEFTSSFSSPRALEFSFNRPVTPAGNFATPRIIIPRPQQIQTNRKSIDNRSEMSYGNPLTPADSGRFSLSFMTDSEFEHCDGDDNGRDSNVPFSRADSGIEVMEPFSPGSNCDNNDNDHDNDNENENDTLRTLKTLFPATFSDPERAEALKALYKQPEDDENYMQWKNFIDEKTANEQEFNIHEYGGEILNSFASHSTDKLNFETIVQDKSVQDITRYFVSALQLANTYNVEIVDKCPGEIRPDNMELKFITGARAHEEIDSHLNDISEDHFIENLVKSKKYHSTPIHPDVATKRSLHKISKRKRLDYCY